MTGVMPEIGSMISLISKADIRYEGRLYTVDPQECTIALASVRSFGTEERDTQYPIAPQQQIYDYILFRGSDIKDIRIVHNVASLPNDPAIMQMQLPPQMGQHGFQAQFPVPVMGHIGPQIGQFGGFNPLAQLSGAGLPGGLAPGSIPSQGMNKQKQPSELNFGNAGIPESTHQKDQGGSRSTTPQSLLSRKSPTVDMGVQVNQPQNAGSRRGGNQRNRERRDSGRGNRDNDNQSTQSMEKGNNMRNQRPNQPMHPQQLQHQQQQQQMQQHGPQQQRGEQNNRGWNRGSGNMMRGRGRGRGGPNQGVFRQAGQNPRTGPNKIKFDSDYDFEQANTKFEELRTQLAKLKVGEEAVKPEQVNGEVEKKDDSGNETGAGDHEQEDDDSGYDKTKSFFDNISCEASIERAKGKNRTDWRQERKLNSETFGFSSTRRGGGRGGYFNNRNPNMGGFRGGYRTNFNHRGRGSGGTGRPQPSHPQQQQQQQQLQQLQQQPQKPGGLPQNKTPTVAAGGQ